MIGAAVLSLTSSIGLVLLLTRPDLMTVNVVATAACPLHCARFNQTGHPGLSENSGTLFWGPGNKGPTI